MQKGLIVAVREVIPEAYHRMCARHIYAAWSKRFRGDERKVAFWAVSKSTYMNQLTENTKQLKLLGDGIFEAVAEYPLHTWCNAFFSKDAKCDLVDNNMCETFNGWILDARTKPIISMVDEIRQQIMKRNVSKRKSVDSWKGNISPKAMEKVGKNELQSHDWIIDWNGEEAYEVTLIFNFAKRHTVDLSKRECSCRE
ncbi:uncharacterized protein [Euphorbia lathyris]|uniref:uncharacterized protein n=1 Tax=Euphorbia lathyris TaxID=212925 RepID=UPI00331402FA